VYIYSVKQRANGALRPLKIIQVTETGRPNREPLRCP